MKDLKASPVYTLLGIVALVVGLILKYAPPDPNFFIGLGLFLMLIGSVLSLGQLFD